MYIFISKINQQWFQYWLVACSVLSHYLDLYQIFLIWIIRNKPQSKFNQNLIIFINENVTEKVVCKMTTIFCQCQCVEQVHKAVACSAERQHNLLTPYGKLNDYNTYGLMDG